MSSKYTEQMTAKPYFPYKMGYLTDWMVRKARDELNETEENRAKALKKIRELIAKEKNFDCWTDDAYLLQYLRAGKFNVKKAFDRLQHFYAVKKDSPDVFPPDFDYDLLMSFSETGFASCLPYRDDNGSVIVVYKISNWDPDVHNFALVFLTMTVALSITIEDPATQVCGVRLLIDAKDMSLKQIRQITPRYFKLFAHALKNTQPIRFKGIHVCYESSIFSYLYSVVKFLLPEKITKRFHFHGSDMKDLHKYLPKEILPLEYGGDNIDFSATQWCRKELPYYRERLLEMLNRGYA